jgi:hypothetical protein
VGNGALGIERQSKGFFSAPGTNGIGSIRLNLLDKVASRFHVNS